MRRARLSPLFAVVLVAGAGVGAGPAQSALATGPVATRALIGATGLVPQPGVEPAVVGDAPGPVVIGRIVLGSAYRGVPGLGVVVETNTYNHYWLHTWTRAGRAVTDGQGYVRIRIPKPVRDISYRVRFGGTGGYRPSTSAVKNLTVLPVVAMTGSPAEIVAGAPFTVTGTFRPLGVAGLRAQVETQCHDGAAWSTPERSFPVAPDGTFTITQTVPTTKPILLGTTALRVLVTGPIAGDSMVSNARSAAAPTAIVRNAGDPHLPGAPGDCVTVSFGPGAPAAPAPTGPPVMYANDTGIQAVLTWTGSPAEKFDLNLSVVDPKGQTLDHTAPTTPEGGTLSADDDACGSAPNGTSTETITWPPYTAPHGTYDFWVTPVASCDGATLSAWTISIYAGTRLIGRDGSAGGDASTSWLSGMTAAYPPSP